MALDGKRLFASAYEPTLQKVGHQITRWKEKTLSFVSKVALVKLVLQSMLIYLLASGWVKIAIIQ